MDYAVIYSPPQQQQQEKKGNVTIFPQQNPYLSIVTSDLSLLSKKKNSSNKYQTDFYHCYICEELLRRGVNPGITSRCILIE